MDRSLKTKILSTLLFLCSAAHAEEPITPQTEARQLKALGEAAFARGDYQAALDFLQDAYRHFPSANLHFNFALTFQKLGREADAANEYDLFLNEAKDASAAARDRAQRELAELEKRVGRVTVVCNEGGAGVTIDDHALAAKSPWDRPLFLSAGKHAIAVAKAGFLPSKLELDVQAGSEQSVNVQLVPEPAPVIAAPPVAPAPMPTERPTPRPVVPLLVGGVALASLGTGLGLVLSVVVSAQGNACVAKESCDAQTVSSWRTRETAGDVLLGVGAAAVAADVVLWVLHRRHIRTQAHAQTWIAPAPNGLYAGGQF